MLSRARRGSLRYPSSVTARTRYFASGFVGFFGCLAILTASGRAEAYCRTTTASCTPDEEDCFDENGCPRKGVPLTWKALPLSYRFYAGGSSKIDDQSLMRKVIRNAFQAWTNATCDNKGGRKTSLTFTEGSDVSQDKPLDNATDHQPPFGIYFRDDTWPHEQADETLALTNQKFGETSGTITYADIEVNTAQNEFALLDIDPGIDLQSVVTHEVGHYIGLAHSQVSDSIMAPSYCQNGDKCSTSKDISRALGDDDVKAVCALYPPDGIAGVVTPAEPGGCDVSSTPARRAGAGDALAAAGVLGLAFSALRRARRSSAASRGRRSAGG